MARLGDICTIVSGTTPKSSCPEYWNGDINWVTPAELNDESDIICESQRKITKQAVLDSSLKSFPAGTVLLSSRAPIGKVAIAGTEMYCNQGFKNLICSDAIYNRYLYHFLKSKTEYLNSLGRGATFKEISKSIVEEIEIPLPSLEEQRRIAALLDKVSDLIAKRRAQLDKLDLLVKARFVEMFGGDRPTERLECFATLITKGASPRWQGVEYEESGTLFITSENVRPGHVDFEKRKYLNNRINEIQPRSILRRNDILINIVGASIGRAAVFESDELANINQAVALVRIDTKKLNLKFLTTFLNSSRALELYSAMKKGGARDNLSLKNIADLPIPAVPITLQKRFADYLFQTEKSKLTIQQSLDKLEMLKKAMMQKYFG